MNTTAKSTPLPTREQYEAREMAEFRRQMAATDIKGGREFRTAMAEEPELVAQRVSWLLSGTYGWGSCHAAHDVLQNLKMNREAWLVSVVGALEWQSATPTTHRNRRNMTTAQRDALSRAVQAVIRDTEEEVKENGRPA